MTRDVSGKELRNEVTPYPVYRDRRRFLRGGFGIASVAATYATYRWFNPVRTMELQTDELKGFEDAGLSVEDRLARGYYVDEPMTSESDIISYNNFYEFTTDKNRVADVAKGFKTEGWQISIDGLVENPLTLSMQELLELGPIEERIYRMRCVESWSMVIPWAGFPLARVLQAARPLANAKYVAMQTLYDPQRMPGQKTDALKWPYVEGLRMDEAMHPLTILAVGLYGRELPAQDGAPVRLVVPWKYGFKGIKSIVKISLVDKEPPTSWNRYAPNEYGFLANVNPSVPHPRWSQATEQRIGESGRRQTLMFNGYESQVASLYDGLDLSLHF
jgi:methionine sulfoxide reductase catalytic subunit